MTGTWYAYYWWLCGHEFVASTIGIAAASIAGLLIVLGAFRVIAKGLQSMSDDEREFFVGQWLLDRPEHSGGTEKATLFDDGNATRKSPDDTSSKPVVGFWACKLGEARVTWDDGWTDVIRCVPGGKTIRILFCTDEAPEPYAGYAYFAPASKTRAT